MLYRTFMIIAFITLASLAFAARPAHAAAARAIGNPFMKRARACHESPPHGG